MKTSYVKLSLIDEKKSNLLSLDEIKKFLKVSGSSDDDQISDLFNKAVSFAERFCATSLREQSYKVVYSNQGLNCEKIILPTSNIESIEEIKIIFLSGLEKTLDSKLYHFDINSQILFFKNNCDGNLIQIRFKTYVNEIENEKFEMPLLKHINLLYKKRLTGMANIEISLESEIENLYKDLRVIGI